MQHVGLATVESTTAVRLGATGDATNAPTAKVAVARSLVNMAISSRAMDNRECRRTIGDNTADQGLFESLADRQRPADTKPEQARSTAREITSKLCTKSLEHEHGNTGSEKLTGKATFIGHLGDEFSGHPAPLCDSARGVGEIAAPPYFLPALSWYGLPAMYSFRRIAIADLAAFGANPIACVARSTALSNWPASAYVAAKVSR